MMCSMSIPNKESDKTEEQGKIVLNAVKTRHQTEQDNNFTVWNMGHSINELRQLQSQDNDIGYILNCKLAGKKPFDNELQDKSPATRHYCHLWDSLTIKDGLLFKEFTKQNKTGHYLQFLTPEKLKIEVLHQMHNSIISGHLGKRKTTEKLLQRFYWYELRDDVTI